MNSFGIGFSFIIHHSVFSVPDRLPPRKPASDGSSTDLLRFFPSCLSTPSWVDLEYGLNTKPQLTSAPVSPVAPIISEKPFSRRVPSSLHPVPAVGPGEWIDRLSSSEDGWSAPPATKRGFQQREQPQGQALARQIAYRLCRAENPLAVALESSRNPSQMFNQNITFAANQVCRSPPVPVPRPARFNVEVITPRVVVLVGSVPGLA